MDYDENNVFAKIMRDEIPSERVYEDDHTLVIMDIMPRTDGHVLVLPKQPARNMLDASTEQLAACMATVQKISRALLKAFGATGITLQQFNEAAGGQEVFHLHFHVLPRHDADRLLRPGNMGDAVAIKANAEKIRAALSRLSPGSTVAKHIANTAQDRPLSLASAPGRRRGLQDAVCQTRER